MSEPEETKQVSAQQKTDSWCLDTYEIDGIVYKVKGRQNAKEWGRLELIPVNIPLQYRGQYAIGLEVLRRAQRLMDAIEVAQGLGLIVDVDVRDGNSLSVRVLDPIKERTE